MKDRRRTFVMNFKADLSKLLMRYNATLCLCAEQDSAEIYFDILDTCGDGSSSGNTLVEVSIIGEVKMVCFD